MNIVHIATHSHSGGAARAAHRLHQGLRTLGEESRFLALNTGVSSENEHTTRFLPPHDLASRLRRRWARYRGRRVQRGLDSQGARNFSTDRSAIAQGLLSQVGTADVINLHWVAGFLDYSDFLREAAQQSPIVWTLHDMNPFTGGCHYDGGCDAYTERCGACPVLGSTRSSDASRTTWLRKQRVFRALPDNRLVFVAPSRWLAREAKRSSLVGRFQTEVIPYGINTATFAPRKRTSARTRLNLPHDATVVLFVAASLADERKGFRLLVDAMATLTDMPDLLLVSLGRDLPSGGFRTPHTHLGFVDDDYRLSEVYSAADIFVAPATEDNLPNTVLEAMACGTPVAAFNIGGIAEMVRDGETGRLARSVTPASLGRCVAALATNAAQLSSMAARCRQVVVGEYSAAREASSYASLYRDLIGRSAPKSRSAVNGPRAGNGGTSS